MSVIGNKDINLSAIGLGSANFGREIDKAAAFAIMDRALTRNINLFDTAPSYGKGVSESIIGEWLLSRHPGSGSIFVSTKASPPYNIKGLIKSVDESLNRLRIERIDIFYLHSWDPTAQFPEILAALNQLVMKGKVRMLGASNFTAEQLERTLDLQRTLGLATFGFLQNNNNFAIRDINDGVRDVCLKNEMKIISYSPLGAGFLTGKYENTVPIGTRFDTVPQHRQIYFQKTAFDRLKLLKQIAARTGYSEIQLGLAWAFHQPDVTSVLIGGRTPMHIDQAFSAFTDYPAELLSHTFE